MITAIRRKTLLVWYAVLILLLLELAAFQITGQVALLLQRHRWEAFSHSMNQWQPAGNVPYADIINRYAKQHEVSGRLVAAVIEAESSFQPQAVSWAGAYGLMQIIPGTWKQVNKEAAVCRGRHEGDCTVKCYLDPDLNIHIGTVYLSQLVKRYNANIVLALAAYNAGPGAVDRYMGIPPFAETQGYVRRIVGNWEKRTPEYMAKAIIMDCDYWFAAHTYTGWMLLATLPLLVATGCRLYRIYGSWRWR